MRTITLLFAIFFVHAHAFAQNSGKKVDVHELAAILDEGLLIIDVRTDLEFNKGHIPGAVNIDLQSKSFENQVSDFDHNRAVYVYCHNGQRAFYGSEKLISMGFTNVYALVGGMIRWQQANKPVNY